MALLLFCEVRINLTIGCFQFTIHDASFRIEQRNNPSNR
jgi:hypothetical protein